MEKVALFTLSNPYSLHIYTHISKFLTRHHYPGSKSPGNSTPASARLPPTPPTRQTVTHRRSGHIFRLGSL